MEASKYVPSGQIFIIPTMLGECDIRRHLRQYHIENLAEEFGINRLIQSIGIALEKSFEADEPRIRIEGSFRKTFRNRCFKLN